MDEHVQKPSWGLTAWAVAGFACVMVVVYLTGMNEVAEVASAVQR